MTVRSPKTEHHTGKESRVVPLFSELRSHLEQAFDEAEEGAEFVIVARNFRTHLERIIARAGLTTWPKLFQNLRSTRQTELAEKFPAHVVCAWMGNSEDVARDHYLQVTDAHFEAACSALQNPVQFGAASTRSDSHRVQELSKKTPCIVLPMGGTGLEPVTFWV